LGFWTLIRLEIMKLRRNRAVALGLGSLVAFLLLMLWGFYSYASRQTGGLSLFREAAEHPTYFNGLLFSLYSVYFAFHFVMPVVVAMIAGAQIAGEAHGGTLRAILSRPVGRAELVVSKFLVTALYAWLVLAAFIALNLLTGFVLVGWGDLGLYPGPLGLVDEPGSIARNEALLRFGMATLSGTWSLLTLIALAFLFSVIVDTPVVSVTAAILVYLILTVIGRVEFFSDIKPYFFTTDMDFWRVVFKPEIPWRELAWSAMRCGAYIFGLLLVAVVLFERRDITT
jgi:ABC-2 type transport system permease protein